VAWRALLERGPHDHELREAQTRAMGAPPISTIFILKHAFGEASA
jgi:hypothetical protein